MNRPRIAIIGSGISGLTVARHLHAENDITIFEASSWVGGHTHTIDVERDGQQWAVDTGFIVFNDRTYPNFIEMLDELKVPSQPAPMTFSVRCDATDLEYRGADLPGLFAQRKNIFRPRFYRLLQGIIKFNKAGVKLIEDGDDRMTVKQFFETNKFSRDFYEYYFLPMGSAIWSCPQSTFEEFPIRFIADFYHHHGLLSVKNRPQWRVISGGSRSYVAPLIADFKDRIRLDTPVHHVHRQPEQVTVSFAGGREVFDHVVFACHADQALRLLGDKATSSERQILCAFPYESNDVVLHHDEEILPKRRRAWAAWNYLMPDSQEHKASLTYCMNILQSFECQDTFCVTLNNTDRINPNKIIQSFNYWHPVFDARRKEMQQRHGELLGPQRTSFCGAYWGNGFHEDGVVSGLAVVNQFKQASATNSSKQLDTTGNP
ncbi:MAG: NAD(P)-binding protein [Planctomycetaceae bacterium]|nr:NAD(P)-binding protein [Planctomycetaceae bacterium]MCP4463294.1 NAD(P)-binding protein [Planctomycetaceae bacterium]